MVKPTIVRGFDYKTMAWADLPATDPDEIISLVPVDEDKLSPVIWSPGLPRATASLPVPHVRCGHQSAFANVHPRLAGGVAQGRRACLNHHHLHWNSDAAVAVGVGGNRRELGRTSNRVAPHAVWSALAWILSIMAGLGIITGALFFMPAVTAFVGSFFVDEIADVVERDHYPG